MVLKETRTVADWSLLYGKSAVYRNVHIDLCATLVLYTGRDTTHGLPNIDRYIASPEFFYTTKKKTQKNFFAKKIATTTRNTNKKFTEPTTKD